MKILLFGNSGSGKSTLARQLGTQRQLAHLDLDTIAWQDVTPPQRARLDDSLTKIRAFTDQNDSWVIEGCYSDLLELVAPDASHMIYLNLPVETCIENARNRPWEPHKYASKKLQDENLSMLVDWIADYTNREDTFSKKAHVELYKNFKGKKTMYKSNDRDRSKND